jgi:hypothetical protein
VDFSTGKLNSNELQSGSWWPEVSGIANKWEEVVLLRSAGEKMFKFFTGSD